MDLWILHICKGHIYSIIYVREYSWMYVWICKYYSWMYQYYIHVNVFLFAALILQAPTTCVQVRGLCLYSSASCGGRYMTHYTHVNVFLFTALILRAPLVLCHPNMYNQFSISTERKLERERERESGRRERESGRI